LALTKFPEEAWIRENGVQLSKTRKIQSEKSKNAKDVLEKEMEIASMLAAAGHFVWMLPENNAVGKNPDAIIDGLIYDFKQVKLSKVEQRFVEALKQANNVVLRLLDERNVSRVLGKIKKHVKNKKVGTLFVIIGSDVRRFDFDEI
jgi:predicted extracellular nuclease